MWYGSTTSVTTGSSTVTLYPVFDSNLTRTSDETAASGKVQVVVRTYVSLDMAKASHRRAAGELSKANAEFLALLESIKRVSPPPTPEPRPLPRERLKARFGFQQMCRIPCYRGVRTR